MTITNANLNNLDLDMGVGKLSLTSKILGNSKIDSGIGEIDLNLVGNKEDYKLHIDKGIGNVTADGTNLGDDSKYGDGNNYIDIDGGIGSINIDFVN